MASARGGSALRIVRAARACPTVALDIGVDPAVPTAAGSPLPPIAAALAELDVLHADAVASMRDAGNAPDAPRPAREAWWTTRRGLDARLAGLVAGMDAAWLGPWRCLLLGRAPGGVTRGGCAAAAFVAGPLTTASRGSAPHPSLAGAAALLAAGAPDLDDGELECGFAELLAACGGGGVDAPSAAAAAAAAVRAEWAGGGGAPAAPPLPATPAPARRATNLATPAAPPPLATPARRRGGLLTAMKDEAGRVPARDAPPATPARPRRPPSAHATPAALTAGVARLSLTQGGAAAARAARRGPLQLCLDDTVQRLPWEAVPGLAGTPVFRCPSLAVAAATCARWRAEKAGVGDHSTTTLPSADAAAGTYLINPGGDLPSTQAALEPLLTRAGAGWAGAAGAPPLAPRVLAERLASPSLYVYAGHGGGEPYLPQPPPPRRPASRATAVLLGCSSGALAPRGERAGACGGAIDWLAAGAPAAIATLWDVTDRDIDRFALAALADWLPVAAAAAGAENMPPSHRPPDRTCVARTVARARRACRLPHLMGGAVVVYGVPTEVCMAQGDGVE